MGIRLSRAMAILGLAAAWTSAPIGAARAQWTRLSADDIATGTVGSRPAMEQVNGRPAVVFANNSTGRLHYMRALDATGAAWPLPIPIAGTANPDTGSLKVVAGNPASAHQEAGVTFDLIYVRATDADGTAWGTPITVDSAGTVGAHASLAIANGNPAIAYYDQTNGALKYVRATDATGSAWGAPITIDTANDSGHYCSLAIVNGNPAISYHDATLVDLKYVRATNADGSAWGTPVTIDSTNNTGLYTSLAVVNGNPAIAYEYGSTTDVRYVRSSDVNGSAWGAPVTVAASANQIGLWSHLLVVNGNPAIGYLDATASAANFVAATDANGASWGAPINVGAASPIVKSLAMAVINGNPAFARFAGTPADSVYIRAVDAAGAAWGAGFATIVTLAGDRLPGQHSSIAVVNGKPAIAYYESARQELCYTQAADALGTAWNTPVVLDSSENVGHHASLAVVNGRPAVAYQDVGAVDLKYVQALDADGAAWGAPLIADGAGGVNSGGYASLAVVNGRPAIATIRDTTVAFIRAADADGAAWNAPVAASAFGVSDTSLAIISGNPAIAFYDGALLRYVRATDADGAAWAAVVSADPGPLDVGLHASLVEAAGRPAIAYQDVTNDFLYYVRASDAGGSAWGTPQYLDGWDADAGEYAAMKIVGGVPVIAYRESLNQDLKYVRGADAAGLAWERPQLVETVGNRGQYISLAEVGGDLGIASYNPGGAGFSSLRYAVINCAQSPANLTAEAAYTVGEAASMAVVGNHPAMVYYKDNTPDFDVRYMRATDPAGNEWGAAVDVPGNPLGFKSIAIANGNPAVLSHRDYARALDPLGAAWPGLSIPAIPAYGRIDSPGAMKIVAGFPAAAFYDGTNFDLEYVRATDLDGSSWGAAVQIDTGGNVGQYAWLEVVNGNPAIAYFDATNANLKYVRATNAAGTAWGTPVVVDGVAFSFNCGYWASLAVINGNPAIAYADRSSTQNLLYVRANDANGAAWGTPVLVDAETVDMGEYANLSTIGGVPFIATRRTLGVGVSGTLAYFVANDANGATWGTIRQPDIQSTGLHVSLAPVNGGAGIAYNETAVGDVKYAFVGSACVIAPTPSPTPSLTPTASISPTASLTPSPSQSLTPSMTASQTASLTPSLTASPSPTQSLSPTVSMTTTATSSASPTAPPSPTASISPTPNAGMDWAIYE